LVEKSLSDGAAATTECSASQGLVDNQLLIDFISTQANQAFSYTEVGLSRQQAPRGYTLDHNRINLGNGSDIFQRAKVAIWQWKMFDMPWVSLCWPDTPI
jgi:hypothetical protein